MVPPEVAVVIKKQQLFGYREAMFDETSTGKAITSEVLALATHITHIREPAPQHCVPQGG
jgi:hypothetical protein